MVRSLVRYRFLWVLVAALALSVLASAQGVPPGGGGGGIGSGWAKEFRTDGTTHVTTTYADGTVDDHTANWQIRPPDWPSTPPSVNLTAHVPAGGRVDIVEDGTVTIRFTWYSSAYDPAPDHLWLLVSPSASWAGNATGSVSEPFDDPVLSTSTGQSQSGTHPIRKQTSGGTVILSYHVHAEVHSSSPTGGFVSAGCGVDALQTNMGIDLGIVGYGAHYKKVPTGRKLKHYYLSPDNWWVNPHQDYFEYDEAVPMPVEPSNDDLQVIRFIDFGLFAPDWSGSYGDPANGLLYPQISLAFQGSATSMQLAPETYLYGLSRGSDVGETLPTGLLGQGWDILPTRGIYYNPWFNTDPQPKGWNEADANYHEVVTFKYTWRDGIQGKAVLDIRFHAPADHEEVKKVIGYINPAPTNWQDYVFTTHSEWSWPNAASQLVIHDPATEEMTALSKAIEITTDLLGLTTIHIPELGKLVATWLGDSLNIPGEVMQPYDLIRGDSGDFWEAEAAGRVSPSDWEERLSLPAGVDPIRFFKWKGQYAQDNVVSYSVADTWDEAGYTGQQVFKKDWKTDMCASTKRYWFKLDGT